MHRYTLKLDSFLLISSNPIFPDTLNDAAAADALSPRRRRRIPRRTLRWRLRPSRSAFFLLFGFLFHRTESSLFDSFFIFFPSSILATWNLVIRNTVFPACWKRFFQTRDGLYRRILYQWVRLLMSLDNTSFLGMWPFGFVWIHTTVIPWIKITSSIYLDYNVDDHFRGKYKTVLRTSKLQYILSKEGSNGASCKL